MAGAVLAMLAGVPSLTGLASAAPYDASADGYSMKSLTEHIGVVDLWNQGFTGAGVDVAIIDTGIAPVKGLDAPGKVIYGPDLSFESQNSSLANLDTNGHGTFQAGLIAGKDAELTWPYADAPASAYRGIAPDARILSIKVANADGGVDVTQVIAAINWVVDHKNDNGMNIRVLSLAYGTNSTQSYLIDPLSFAAERAWRAGIVVVAAAGNTGYQRGAGAPGLADPAYNPTVIAVGGYDTKGTADRSDDAVGSYSASAKTRSARKPDFVAVGSRLQGLRVPNSYIDARHGTGRLGDRYFRGSGTSEATAVSTGIVALLLQKYPWLQPDQVKRYMKATASPLWPATPASQGSGALDPRWMAAAEPMWTPPQMFPPANGSGSVELSRGRDHISMNGVELRGEIDVFGHAFAPGTAGWSWNGGQWNGSTWSGSSWSGSSWSGSTWSGSTWSGSSWSGSSWSGASWGDNPSA